MGITLLTETTGMASILTSIGSIITACLTWATSIIGWFTTSGNELGLLFVLMPFVGYGVKYLRKLVRV